ncbi:MAG TPA: cyanophycinase [Chitinophagaceae bacterium]|nr:cyanophycinase [Chitinophagaceae bacterium]
MRSHLTILASLLFACLVQAQQGARSKGKLFIIGGGDRPPSLMQALVKTSGLSPNDYVVVLPMSSASPDRAYEYFKADLEPFCRNTIVNFNFTPERVNDQNWLDSLQKAKLIFITGGDQDRFMKAVQNTAVYQAIHRAYQNGATIGGTSAGAAVMSEHMITGHELQDTVYRSTFNKLRDNNIEFKQGLGLLTTAIIDQHFIVRSRYNRLLSALARFPALTCIGIDEETAIIVDGSVATVTGERQVVIMKKPEEIKALDTGLIKVKEMQFSIFTSGDSFQLN